MWQKILGGIIKLSAFFRSKIIFIFTMALLCTFPAYAQEALWNELNSKVIKFYQQDQYPGSKNQTGT